MDPGGGRVNPGGVEEEEEVDMVKMHCMHVWNSQIIV